MSLDHLYCLAALDCYTDEMHDVSMMCKTGNYSDISHVFIAIELYGHYTRIEMPLSLDERFSAFHLVNLFEYVYLCVLYVNCT